MTLHLIVASDEAAAARSQAAWQARIGRAVNGTDTTRFLWGWRAHPVDGRAALAIRDQADLALLSGTEADALIADLPGDWNATAAP